jgi:hypothetical protein
MANNKRDRKLKLAAETVRVLNPRRKKRNVIDHQAARTNASSVCPTGQDPPPKR